MSLCVMATSHAPSSIEWPLPPTNRANGSSAREAVAMRPRARRPEEQYQPRPKPPKSIEPSAHSCERRADSAFCYYSKARWSRRWIFRVQVLLALQDGVSCCLLRYRYFRQRCAHSSLLSLGLSCAKHETAASTPLSNVILPCVLRSSRAPITAHYKPHQKRTGPIRWCLSRAVHPLRLVAC